MRESCPRTGATLTFHNVLPRLICATSRTHRRSAASSDVAWICTLRVVRGVHRAHRHARGAAPLHGRCSAHGAGVATSTRWPRTRRCAIARIVSGTCARHPGHNNREPTGRAVTHCISCEQLRGLDAPQVNRGQLEEDQRIRIVDGFLPSQSSSVDLPAVSAPLTRRGGPLDTVTA